MYKRVTHKPTVTERKNTNFQITSILKIPSFTNINPK